MKSLLSEITKELPEEQQKIAGAIDITKTVDEILSDFVAQHIVSFKVKDYTNDQKV
jgi:hypothetical protein